jgi:hypothetical protein
LISNHDGTVADTAKGLQNYGAVFAQVRLCEDPTLVKTRTDLNVLEVTCREILCHEADQDMLREPQAGKISSQRRAVLSAYLLGTCEEISAAADQFLERHAAGDKVIPALFAAKTPVTQRFPTSTSALFRSRPPAKCAIVAAGLALPRHGGKAN